MSISIASALSNGAEALHAAGIADARIEAGSLLAHSLGRNRVYLITHSDHQVTADQLASFLALIDRRGRGEPQQYITGHQEFFKLDFEVNRDVLIPRPETELLVEVSLELLKDTAEPLIADIGTGSGCIAISLLRELPSARVVAADISAAALAVAQRNAAHHGVASRLELIESDCFSMIDSGRLFSLIVSNPPYVSDEELRAAPREVREHEPHLALAGGVDGLSVIRRLLADAGQYLRAQGHFVFEIGFGQNKAVRKLIELQNWELLEIRNDLQGIPRTVVLQKSS